MHSERIKSILLSPDPVDEDKKVENILNVLADPGGTLTSLDLLGNYIGDAGAIALAEVLKDPRCTLTSLTLEGNSIVPEGAKALAKALEDPNCTLTSLSLEGNGICSEGAIALAIALEEPNCTLTSLNLRSNDIGPEGAKALAEALKTNSTLTSLDLRYNDIGPEGAKALAIALEDPNCTLTSLDLRSNNIGPEGAIAFANALKTNRTLTSLYLGQNYIGHEGAIALAIALEDPNCTLTSLDLQYNQINLEGVKALAEALQTNSTLTSLYLPGRYIDSDTQTVLFEAVLACAQKGHLIQINAEFSANQKQKIKDAYQAYVDLAKSHQRLALATALLTPSTPSTLLNLDVLDLITEAHTNRTTPVQPDVIERYSTDRLESTQKMSLEKQRLLNMSLGLLTSAFTAHLLDLTFDTTTILSTPFAMILAVGLVVATLAFFVTSSCRPFCLTSAGNRQHTASKELDPATAHTALGDPSDLPTLNATNNAQLASR